MECIPLIFVYKDLGIWVNYYDEDYEFVFYTENLN